MLCVRAAMALAELTGCAGLSEPSLKSDKLPQIG